MLVILHFVVTATKFVLVESYLFALCVVVGEVSFVVCSLDRITLKWRFG